jgi:hypothetical protein
MLLFLLGTFYLPLFFLTYSPLAHFGALAKLPLGDIKDPNKTGLSPFYKCAVSYFSWGRGVKYFDLKGLLFQLNDNKQHSYLCQPNT